MKDPVMTPLLETHRKCSWMRFRTKGQFKIMSHLLYEIQAYGSIEYGSLPASGYNRTNHHVKCTEAILLLTKAEKLAREAVDEFYEAYRRSNPPIRDKRK